MNDTQIQKNFRALALIDRDGCLIVEKHYLHKPEEVEFIPGSLDGIRLLQEQGVACVLCTNQSGVARGKFSEADVEKVHDHLKKLLANEGIELQGIYSSFDHPDAVDEKYRTNLQSRKPQTGMADQAKKDLGLEDVPVFAIGDKLIDVEFGDNAGGFGIQVRTGHGAEELSQTESTPEHFVANDLCEAAEQALLEMILWEFPDDALLHSKLKNRHELSRITTSLKSEEKKVAFANGCFDLLHGGHISFLDNSRAAGDMLILGLNSNTSIRRLKGEGRPVLDEPARIQLISALKAVDYLTIFYEDSADATLRLIHPTHHAKGTDYTNDNVPELQTTRELGIETVIAGAAKENSSRDIIEVILERSRAGLL